MRSLKNSIFAFTDGWLGRVVNVRHCSVAGRHSLLCFTLFGWLADDSIRGFIRPQTMNFIDLCNERIEDNLRHIARLREGFSMVILCQILTLTLFIRMLHLKLINVPVIALICWTFESASTLSSCGRLLVNSQHWSTSHDRADDRPQTTVAFYYVS